MDAKIRDQEDEKTMPAKFQDTPMLRLGLDPDPEKLFPTSVL